jgi:hypothetical protein
VWGNQLVEVKHKYNSLINIIPLSYLHDDYHKQAVLISESRGDLNQCTPYREKPDQHTELFPRLIRALSPILHLMWSVYSNLSLVPTRSKQAPTPGRSIGNQRETDLAVVLGHLILPPPQQPWSRGEMFSPRGYTTT